VIAEARKGKTEVKPTDEITYSMCGRGCPVSMYIYVKEIMADEK
jgi:hypothetical protein